MPTTEVNDALPLSNYFAVQLFSEDTDRDAVASVFQASMRIRKFFRRLEVLDTFTMGTNKFLRCRVDQPEIPTILQEVLDGGRGVLARWDGAYIAKLPGGRTGTVNAVKMHLEVKDGHQRLYKGTRIKGWEMQFPV